MSPDSGAKDESEGKSVSLQLKEIMDMVREEPTQINYWNAYKRIQRLDLEALNIPYEKRIKVALLSSFTIDPLSMYIDIKSRLVGLYPEIYIGPFNQYQQEILDDSSKLYAFNPDVIILSVQAESLLGGDFYSEFANLSKGKKERHQVEIVHQFENVISELTSRTNALVLVNNFMVPSFSVLGTLDNKTDMGFRAFFRGLNKIVTDLYRESKQVYVVDLENVASKHGKSRCLNYQMYYLGSFGFSESFLPVIAEEYVGHIKALKNLTRKCIVLDLDNTLWGGILAEEGLDGIKLGKDSPGNAYMDFQRLLLSYYNRGILLAINSNNSYEDVIRVIREHPYMVLREKQFAAMRVNWQNKVQNMIELAEEINIGLDSMVFVDDLPQNREQIRQTLPQVLVVDTPHSPFLYRQALEALNDFNVLALTEEDRRRGEMYHARRKREHLRKSKITLEDFLRSLEMKAVIEHANEFSLPRITRLVNKTNQFNLTTRRYTDAEIKEMSKNRNEFNIYSLRVIDKFGDEGIVGVAIIRKNLQTWTLDSFLMSCRVIGRGAETAFLAKIVADAKKNGVTTLIGEYVPTRKNEPANSFYRNHGFKKFQEQGTLSEWRIDLIRSTVKIPEWVEFKDG